MTRVSIKNGIPSEYTQIHILSSIKQEYHKLKYIFNYLTLCTKTCKNGEYKVGEVTAIN